MREVVRERNDDTRKTGQQNHSRQGF